MKFQTLLCSFIFCRILSGSTNFAIFNSTGTSTSWGFTLNGVGGTLTAAPGTTEEGTILVGPTDPTADANFPGTFFTPIPPSNMDWLAININGVNNAPNAVVDTFTLTFSSPITNPTFQFLNLDASQEIFTGATDGSGNPISGASLASSFSLLSGNNVFTTGLTGTSLYDVHPNAITPDNPGCESNAGGNPNGACGSVQLSGTYSSITWYATDIEPSAASGDGWDLQLYAAPEPGTLALFGISLVFLSIRIFSKRTCRTETDR